MASKQQEADESTPLFEKSSSDWTFGVYDWTQNLYRELGYKLFWLLFIVEHLMRGFVSDFAGSAGSYIYKAYNVSGPVMQVYGGITQLPWAMKPLIGLVSDLVPIGGYNKAPYMAISACMGAVAFFVVGSVPTKALPILGVVACFFFQELQLSTNDILAEAKYAERIRDKPAIGPSVLTYVWFGMGAAGMVGLALSGVSITYLGPKALYLICAFPAAAVLVPVLLGYMEERQVSAEALVKARARFWEQKEACVLCVTIFLSCVFLTTVALISADPGRNAMAAVIVFLVNLVTFSVALSPGIAMFNAWSLLQTSLSLSTGGAGFYFATDTPEQYPEGPHFSPFFYNSVIGTVGAILSLVGIASYEKYLSKTSYRSVLVVTNVALSVFNLLDAFFYLRINVRWGIPDHAFVLGTSVFANIINQWQWMPQVVILAYFCPKGMEATMYALLAGCHNLGNTVASSCGAYLLVCMGVNPNGSPHESAQFQNLWKASMIASVLPLISAVGLFKLVPDVKQGDKVLDDACDATSGSLWKRWTGVADRPSAAGAPSNPA
eukprot:TRINITY_DN94077_c0_g1_i1.p1 TRINITY_DN94077_c0_g1~~TRINITY_DN94077_c0_g1_i1.p1  ORF type:complete len:550 (-),score=106.73 TRINITY_DN94077_c0_g1_i1:59-1708(-)